MTMQRRSAPARAARRWLAALLCAVLLAQGLAMGLALAKGPRHQHRSTEGAMALVDFRRDVAVTAPLAHSHGDASVQRHYHAPDDMSVVRAGEDRAGDALGLDEGSSGGQVAVWLGLLSAEPVWNAGNRCHEWVAKPLWSPSTRHAGRLERPPRLA